MNELVEITHPDTGAVSLVHPATVAGWERCGWERTDAPAVSPLPDDIGGAPEEAIAVETPPTPVVTPPAPAGKGAKTDTASAVTIHAPVTIEKEPTP